MGWKHLIRSELFAIFTNIPLLITVFGGIVLYSFLYPLPYLNQVPEKQNVAIINLDQSQLSRTIVRMANATPQINVTQNVYTINAAKRLVTNNQVAGFLLIPKNFYRDLMLEKSPHLLFAGDASYFLVYGTVIEGLVRSTSTLTAQVKVTRMVAKGENIALAASQFTPIGLNLEPSFNPGLGYLNYVVPAVFVLILHQTLLIAAGLLTTGQLNDRERDESLTTRLNSYFLIYPTWQILCIRVTIMLVIYFILASYYFGFSFEYYDINRLANITDIISLLLPFLLSVIFLGILIGLIVPRKELVTLVVLVSSLPLAFSAGFIWPIESMPAFIKIIVQFVPTTPAINAFLRLNQMGATIESLLHLKAQLWGLVFLYGALSYLLMSRKKHLIFSLSAIDAYKKHENK